jgi:hypothetical protein
MGTLGSVIFTWFADALTGRARILATTQHRSAGLLSRSRSWTNPPWDLPGRGDFRLGLPHTGGCRILAAWHHF